MKKKIQYIFILLIVMSAFASCGDGKISRHGQHLQHNEQVYTCSMHPEIIRTAPGNCPICGMKLVKKEERSKAIQNIDLEALLKPANSFVLSIVPVTTVVQRKEDVELNVVGMVAQDTRQAGIISSRVKGRIEKLYIRYKYQPVKKGQRIMDIYSPELLTAQQNLIFVLRNDADNTSLINAAKDRLLLMGMKSSQLDELVNTKSPKNSISVYSNYSGFVTDMNAPASNGVVDNMQVQMPSNQGVSIREGMYIESGQSVLSVYNPAKAWILLNIFPEQQNLIKAGDAVTVAPETSPQQKFRASIDYIEPVFRPGSKTVTARVYFNNAHMLLPIGSRVTATIFGSSTNAAWVPKEAVLSLGRSKVVFLKRHSGFKAHGVTTGTELNKSIQIVTGLSAHDTIAANAQFLIDNEAFIQVSDQ